MTEKFGNNIFTPEDVYNVLEKDDFKIVLEDGRMVYSTKSVTKGIPKSSKKEFTLRLDSFIRKNVIYRLKDKEGVLIQLSKRPQRLQLTKAKMKGMVSTIRASNELNTTEVKPKSKTKPSKPKVKQQKITTHVKGSDNLVTLKDGSTINVNNIPQYQCCELKDGSFVSWLGNRFYRVGDSNSREDFNPKYFEEPKYLVSMVRKQMLRVILKYKRFILS